MTAVWFDHSGIDTEIEDSLLFSNKREFEYLLFYYYIYHIYYLNIILLFIIFEV